MKKITAFLLCAVFLGACIFAATAQDQDKPKNRFQQAVADQRSSDLKRKNELIAQMKTIIGGFNKRLKQSGIKDANLDVPIDMEKIEDIKDNSDKHTSQPELPKVFLFAVNDTPLYASSEGTTNVGSVAFAEKIEILERVEEEIVFKGKTGFWMAVRKSNQDEGWIHSSMLAKDKPTSRQEEVKPVEDDDFSFGVPVSGRRSSNFGSRVDPVTKKQNSFHSGIDIAAPQGTPVKASSAGTIKRAEFNKNGYGNLIVIEHAQDFTTYYGHLSRIDVKVGNQVKKNDLIGAVGSTGKSTGPHLHFEVRRGNKALDPDAYMK